MRGFAAIPRWTTKPVPGVGTHVAKAPADLMATLRGLAEELGVPLGSVLLTAHAKVLVALSGESDVCTGYAPGAEPPLPLRITLRPGSWREALLGTARAQSALQPDGRSPADGLDREPTGPSFETVFQLGQGGGELADGIVLHVLVKGVVNGGVGGHDGCELEVRYRTDVLDDACAARIAGYHVSALSSIAADPDADHGR
ncbi:MAG TPA: non-ribosomal peptide synthetase, partial [Planctomycetota bacterium]|nr:non-ribosomal peptide synthetase [Planctomycetota bacterium]